MFRNNTRLDDIMNILRPPKVDDDDDDKDRRIPDTAIRYDTKKTIGEDTIRFDFAGHSEGLK